MKIVSDPFNGLAPKLTDFLAKLIDFYAFRGMAFWSLRTS